MYLIKRRRRRKKTKQIEAKETVWIFRNTTFEISSVNKYKNLLQKIKIVKITKIYENYTAGSGYWWAH